MLWILTFVIALWSAGTASAQICPSLEIKGLEQKAGDTRAWTASFDLDADQYTASLGVMKRTAEIDTTCSGTSIQIVQKNSSDSDDCTYDLRSAGPMRAGAAVTGRVTCASAGMAELKNARFFNISGPTIMTDAKIVSIIQTADNVAMRFGAIVVGLATKEEVRTFAQTMQDDHKDLNAQVEALAQSQNIKVRPNATSLFLDKLGQQKRADMVKVIGPRVDRQYVESEINFHQRMLATFDQVLIKNAKSDEVKQFLASAREVFANHEHHARDTAPLLGITGVTGGGKVFYFCQPGSRDPC
jgi:putative membrane protein